MSKVPTLLRYLPVVPALRNINNIEKFPFTGIVEPFELTEELQFIAKVDYVFVQHSNCKIGTLALVTHGKNTTEKLASYTFLKRLFPLAIVEKQKQQYVDWGICKEIDPTKEKFESDEFKIKIEYLAILTANIFSSGSASIKKYLENFLYNYIAQTTENSIRFFIDGEANRINEYTYLPAVKMALCRIYEELDIEKRLDLTIKLHERLATILDIDTEESPAERVVAKNMEKVIPANPEKSKSPEDIEKDNFEKKIKNFPKEIQDKIRDHYQALQTIPSNSAEYTTLKTYLNWLVKTPWSTRTDDTKDFNIVKKVLENNHYGLRTVKDRIIEFLAMRKLNPKGKGPILCLVGPPGTGKTSIGESIANALGRKFTRISLGGMRDEAEIRGHRRTYIGALPSRIMQEIVKAGSMNPVFMLDEVDKIGHDFRGDPAAALLEVMDPEQNFHFIDNYLGPEFPVDLSQVLFIATANISDPILPALLNRMECIELPGYDWEDKLEIAKNFLVQKQLEECGLTVENLEKEGISSHIPIFSNEALLTIIRDYTFDAGARRTEQEIQRILRKKATSLVVPPDPNQVSEKNISFPEDILTPDDVRKFLGDPLIHSFKEDVECFPPGVGPILTVDQNGIGNVDFAEAKIILSNPSDQLGGNLFTGNLAEVLKESIAVAISRIEKILPPETIENKHFHFHHDSAAIRKDGPSAGIAYYAMLYSLLIRTPLKPLVAMTGELPLKRNAVFPIGGLKAKIFAAERSRFREIIIPKENMPELKKLPKGITNKLQIIIPDEKTDLQQISKNSQKNYPDKIIIYCIETPEQALTILFPDNFPVKTILEKK